MQTKLTVPISASNAEEAIVGIGTAVRKGADAIELRTDYLEELSADSVGGLIKRARGAGADCLIVTCRDKQQGGCIDYLQELRVEVLTEAINAGSDFVDFEYDNFLNAENRIKIEQALARNSKCRLILSAHNFEGRFEDIEKLYNDIVSAGANILPKLVYTAGHINDCFEGFDLLANAKSELIMLCMGQAGELSRIMAKKLGSFITFACLDTNSATAPGQIRIDVLKRLYHYDSMDEGTQFYGIIGWPVEHSASPLIHNPCFAHMKADKVYVPLAVEGGKKEFDKFMDNILSRGYLDFRGFSVTIPHKENALSYVKQKGGFVEPLAEKIGACNTIIIDKPENGGGQKISAYNTDYAGALDAITDEIGTAREQLKQMEIAVVGAGGVARALVAGLADAGGKITIYNRTVKRAKKLAGKFNCEWAGLDELKNLTARLVVNCTSVGMSPDAEKSPIPAEFIKEDMIVFDTIYNPKETLLLRNAKEKGAKTIRGISMFMNQAAEQFRLFTGLQINIDVMREAISENF